MKTMEQQMKEIVTAFIEDDANQGALDHTDQWITEQLLEAFTDRHYSVDEILVRGEKAVARILVAGTHHGTFAGNTPTGNRVKITQFREFRIMEGEIREHRGWFDTSTLLPQLQSK